MPMLSACTVRSLFASSERTRAANVPAAEVATNCQVGWLRIRRETGTKVIKRDETYGHHATASRLNPHPKQRICPAVVTTPARLS